MAWPLPRLFFPLLLLYTASWAQSGEVSLKVDLARPGPFRVGEAIPLSLSFSASVEGKYQMGMQQYDRSGRLGTEEFVILPQARDPLKRYFEGGFIGGGLSTGPKLLTREPEVLKRELNEWVAIDSPGHYSLSVISRRVSLLEGTAQPLAIELKSNTVEFDVFDADPNWQQQRVLSVAAILDSADSTPEEKKAALRELRFLDSPASIRELVRRASRSEVRTDFDITAGLAGSRDPAAVIKEIEDRVQDPAAAVNAELLRIWSRLIFQNRHEPMPPYPRDNKEQQSAWMKAREAYDLEYWDIAYACELKAAAALRTKQGPARAVTLQSLLFRPYVRARPLPGISSADLASVFLDLPLEQQASMLQYGWDAVKSDAMVPVLRRIIGQADLPHQGLRSAALRRLFELDATEGTAAIRREIAAPHIDNKHWIISFKSLSILPNETLPDMEGMLVSRLESPDSRTRELDAQLVNRYATAKVLPRIKALAETGVGCEGQDALLSYLLRHDLEFGIERVKAAEPFCLKESLGTLVRLKHWQDYEPILVRLLVSKDLNRARSAAEMLGRFGSDSSKKALMIRMRAFSGTWKERADEFTNTLKTSPEVSTAISFQYGITHALATAPGFILSDEEISELEALTLGQHRENIARWHWSSPVELSVSYTGEDEPLVLMASRYELRSLDAVRQKFSQFPGGTRFRLIGPREPKLEAFIARLNEAASDANVNFEDSRQ